MFVARFDMFDQIRRVLMLTQLNNNKYGLKLIILLDKNILEMITSLFGSHTATTECNSTVSLI